MLAIHFYVTLVLVELSLQCLDTVDWASGRASSLYELSDEVLMWLSVWSEVQTVCRPKTPSSPASLKSRLVLPFWYQLTQVVLEKRPLNGCNSSCCCCFS